MREKLYWLEKGPAGTPSTPSKSYSMVEDAAAEMSVTFVLLSALSGLLLWLFMETVIRPTILRKRLVSFKYPDTVPVLGSMLHYLVPLDRVFSVSRFMNAKYGPRYLIHFFYICSLNLCDAESAEGVLQSSTNISKNKIYDFLVPWLGRGLLTNTGSSWRSRRKLLTPAFHFRILEQYGPQIEQHARTLVQEMEVEAQSGKAIDVVPAMSRCTLRAICETAMGAKLDYCGDEKEYFSAIRTVASASLYRLARPWLWNNVIFSFSPEGLRVNKALKVLHGFTEKVIADRKSRLSQDIIDDVERLQSGDDDLEMSHKKRLAFLDILLVAQKNGADLTDVEIRNEVDTFMFEGHETTAMALSWTLFLLGNNPDIQEKAAKEVLDAEPSWKASSNLQYLERVIKESLRICPPVFYIGRVADTPQTIGSDVGPAGVMLDVHIYDVHRDPKYFPDPERFDPDRFLPENERERHPFAYLPFSAGPRNCIGRRFAMLEMKIIIASVLRRFKITSMLKSNEIRMTTDLVLRPKDKMEVFITPRH